MDVWLIWVVVAAESVVLVWLYARAIGWKPRWRWEMELQQSALERRVETLESRFEHHDDPVRPQRTTLASQHAKPQPRTG